MTTSAATVSTVTLEVDEATRQNWISAWTNLDRSFTVPLLAVGDCSSLGTLPTSVSFTGLQLLLAVGRACSRPHVLDDPSNLFALLRYCTSIATSSSLLLASETEFSDVHKKKVLSDELGCGAAFIVADQVFNSSSILDLRTAVLQGWVNTTSSKSRQPDYIGRLGFGNNLLVLEAKGSQQGQEYCSNQQIPSGCQQVQNVVIVDPTFSIQARAAVGIALGRDGNVGATTEILIGDPEPKFPKPYVFEIPIEAALRRTHYLRTGAMTGDIELLRHLGFKKDTFLSGGLREKHYLNEPFVGSEMSIDSTMGSLKIFVGLQQAIRNLILSDAQEDEIQSRALQRSMPTAFERTAVAADGTMLHYELER